MARRSVHLCSAPRRTDAVISAADGHILNGSDRLLFGVHDLQLFDAALFQPRRITFASGQTDVL